MNFLAHIYLSGDNPKIMVGNFIGDFVKGRNLTEQFESEIAKGIELHREIDLFTDTHPIVRESKKRLQPKYRHYAPVIVDVFYDYFLGKYWSDYHPHPLVDFAARSYETLLGFNSTLPAEVQRMLPYMMKGNWLLNYSRLEGIEQALTGMSRRTRFDSKMNESIVDLKEHHDDFKKEFDAFFPELKLHSENFIRQA
jgi:acyl carrier protein phosphodiesterase